VVDHLPSKHEALDSTLTTGKKKKINVFKKILARHWWLTPVILTTQEAEIRKIAV
jgi:hypothetical protein